MSGDHSNPLAQLADIHAAAEPALLPPAPGWWVLAGLTLLLLLFLLRAAARKLAVRRRRKAWISALAAIRNEHDPGASPQAYLAAMNRLFRAVALRAFPDTGCASLEGEAWVAFIAGLMPDDEPVDELAALARGPYEPAPAFDTAALDRLALAWVGRYG